MLSYYVSISLQLPIVIAHALLASIEVSNAMKRCVEAILGVFVSRPVM